MAKMTFVQHEKPAKTEPETPRWVCPDEVYLNDEGNLVEIHLDPDAESPREWDNLGTFYTWHKRYESPDNDTEAARDYRRAKKAPEFGELLKRMGIDEAPLHEMPSSRWIPWACAKMEEKGYAALPVSMYEHSGIVYRTGSPSQFPDSQWDAGYTGLIFASREDIAKSYLVSIDEVDENIMARARECLKSEVELYSEWAEGSCWGYKVYDERGDEVDSCWGFYGDDPEKSGLAEAAGGLYECSYKSLDDYLDAKEREQFVQHWKRDITDIHETLTGAQEDSVRMAMAEHMLEIDGEGYSLDDELAWLDTMNVEVCTRRLTSELEDWHGGHDAMMENVRGAVMVEGKLCFCSGNGYARHDQDLLGGAGTGRAEEAFEHYLETGDKTAPTQENPSTLAELGAMSRALENGIAAVPNQTREER